MPAWPFSVGNSFMTHRRLSLRIRYEIRRSVPEWYFPYDESLSNAKLPAWPARHVASAMEKTRWKNLRTSWNRIPTRVFTVNDGERR